MARYIDADNLIAHLKDEIEGCKKPFGSRANGKGIAYGTELGLKSAISFANTLATADVVPKSEVDWHREAELNAYRIMGLEVELEAMRGSANSYKMHYENAKSEVAREIFEEIEQEIELALESNYKAKNGQMMSEHITNEEREFIEYVNGKIHALGGISYFIAELKKKYTESEGKT